MFCQLIKISTSNVKEKAEVLANLLLIIFFTIISGSMLIKVAVMYVNKFIIFIYLIIPVMFGRVPMYLH